MKEIKRILDELKNTLSRNEKEDILKRYEDNKLLKEILQFVFNPYIVTGLSSKKILKKVNVSEGYNVYDIKDMMQYLKKNNTGKDIDIKNIQHFINKLDEELQELVTQVAIKDLKIGCDAKTINKVYGERFIPTFNVMLAKKFEEHKDKIKNNFIITEKLDGNRIVVVKENGIVKSFTRKGKQYEGLNEIELDIRKLPFDNKVFDGELKADCEGDTLEVYAQTTSKARKKGSNKKGLLFHIFDIIPLNEFQQGKSELNAVPRKNKLSEMFKTFDLPYCREVKPLYIGNDLSKVNELMGHAREEGWEGLMVNLDTPYECKRTDSILKVKIMQTCDLRVIGFDEGTGRNEGKLGALIVDYKGFNVKVGSGYSDVDREYIWNNKDGYLNKIIEVQYFEESKNQNDGISLRFPVYKKLRLDKTEPSYN